MAGLSSPKEQTVMTSTGKRTFSGVTTIEPESTSVPKRTTFKIVPRDIATVPADVLQRNEANLVHFKVRVIDSSCVPVVLSHLGHRPEFVITWITDDFIIVKTMPDPDMINIMLRIAGVKDIERGEAPM